MIKRIFRGTFLVTAGTVFLCVILMVVVLYGHFEGQLKKDLIQETNYIMQGIKQQGMAYFSGLEVIGSRITFMQEDGKVLYDTFGDAETMENHSQREEFVEAMEKGTGESYRISKTLDKKILYYAKKMADGSVIRVATTQYSLVSLFLGMLQPIFLIFGVALFLSLFLAFQLASRIVRPINELDLENPQNNDIYEEIAPLIGKINRQNRTIANQIKDLQQKQQEFTAITENMQEGLLIVDPKTNILSYNTSACMLLGTEKPTENASAFTLNRSEGFRNAIRLAISGKNNEQFFSRGEKQYQIVANPVFDEKQLAGAVVLIMDVTEKQERESLRREFTANVSHELKTPLTSISGTAEIMKNGMVQPADIPHFAENIYQEAQRLITLVGDIIKLSRLDENAVPMGKIQLDLYDVVKNVVKQLEDKAERRQVSFVVEGESAMIEGVKQILEEMVYNLCDNAIQYNIENGLIKVLVKKEMDDVILSISDTGIGIAPNEVERVFERFYRVDKSHSKEIGGTGLGLSIVKHGAMFHGANITMESQLEKGTTITIRF